MTVPQTLYLDEPAGASRPWFVFVSKPRLEAYAASKLQEQGFQVYLPMLPSWKKRNSPAGAAPGHWQAKEGVMFPRYGFVRPESAIQAIGPARSTPGVSHLVRFGTAFGCMAHDKVQALQAAIEALSAASPKAPFDPGNHVVFVSGPLKGLQGIVSSVAAERVNVMMSLLGKDHVVTPDLKDLALA